MHRLPAPLVPSTVAVLSMAFAALPSAALLPAPLQGGGSGATPTTGLVRKTNSPSIFHTFDYDAGVYSLSPVPQGAEAASLVCFANSIDVDQARDALLYPAGNELVDWGVKQCGESLYVDRIRIGYTSVAPAGVGGSLTLRLYENTLGFGQRGTLLQELVLTGLPSDPAPALSPRYLTIELGSQSFYWPDGPAGWSYENSDGMTAPLLVDATIQNGVENFFDVYTAGPAGASTYDNTYFVPASGSSLDPFESSFYLQVSQSSVPSAAVLVQGGFINDLNPNVFVAQTPPLVNSTWSADVDVTGFPGSNITVAFVSSQRIYGTFLAAGELIAHPAFIDGRFSVLPQGHTHDFPIPNDPAVLGLQFHAQGGFLSPVAGPTLTNGYRLTIGSF